ncbi:MAG: septal ring lytic transglycosylase RlpA family protein [Candidatus Portnoybacteria bacterium]|nr:septal ring lytic transglycosylase RlpA family protein [Candidatus Portnoybacteria bacterium]
MKGKIFWSVIFVFSVLFLLYEERGKSGPAVSPQITQATDEEDAPVEKPPPKKKFFPRLEGKVLKRFIYQVREEDCIYSIARKYKVRPDHIVIWNNLESDIIQPGQKLVIKKIKWPTQRGVASWYGPGFHGKAMANNKIYNQNKILVAHRDLPLGTWVEVKNALTGNYIWAPVLDRGPYVEGRIVDLSKGAAKLLGVIEPGLVPVEIRPLS